MSQNRDISDTSSFAEIIIHRPDATFRPFLHLYDIDLLKMKRFILIISVAVLLFPMTACSESFIEESESKQFWGETLVDQSLKNKFKISDFCKEWVYQSTQMEIWEDGQLVEIKDGGLIPYQLLSFRDDGYLESQDGMYGRWKYKYNHIFIDCIGRGGSAYYYEVAEVNGRRLVLREEELIIGGPVEPYLFHNNPSGTHYFWRLTYVKK